MSFQSLKSCHSAWRGRVGVKPGSGRVIEFVSKLPTQTVFNSGLMNFLAEVFSVSSID